MKKLVINSFLILFVFFLDRFSKLYFLNLAEINGFVDIYVNPYINIYLLWNKGIAFGLFSFEQSTIYNFITLLIVIISIVIGILIIRTFDIRAYFYSIILGGSFGNLFDRLYYSAVPDFIDLHINNFHWFVFNVADIFISIGIMCLILVELIFNKYLYEKKN